MYRGGGSTAVTHLFIDHLIVRLPGPGPQDLTGFFARAGSVVEVETGGDDWFTGYLIKD
jgi:hypothetical protein